VLPLYDSELLKARSKPFGPQTPRDPTGARDCIPCYWFIIERGDLSPITGCLKAYTTSVHEYTIFDPETYGTVAPVRETKTDPFPATPEGPFERRPTPPRSALPTVKRYKTPD